MADNVDAELADPTPDVNALFIHYSRVYFGDGLGACFVEWSSARMTLCGGVCEALPGGGARIRLSAPLLALRPRADLQATLLHEMIHAHMFLHGEMPDDEPTGHGSRFKAHMRRISAGRGLGGAPAADAERPPGGYRLAATHDWMAEVEHFRQHHWLCRRCGNLVKRAMNRPPQEADCAGRARGRAGAGGCRDAACAFHMHARHCGGEYEKVKEPEGFADKKRRAKGGGGDAAPPKRPKPAGRPITDFLVRGGGAVGGGGSGPAEPAAAGLPALQAAAGAGAGAAEGSVEERRRRAAEAAVRRMFGGGAASGGGGCAAAPPLVALPKQQQPQQRQQAPAEEVVDLLDSPPAGGSGGLACPVCGRSFPASRIHAHVDACLEGKQ